MRFHSNEDKVKAMTAGVLECIKYHFEPMAMQDNGVYNFDVIREMLPAIKGQRLYGKFGAFYASSKETHPDVAMLSITHKSKAEELIDELEKNGKEEVRHPETGNVVKKDSYQYVLVSMRRVYFDPNDDYRIKFSSKANPIVLSTAVSCVDALKIMAETATGADRVNKKKKRRKGRKFTPQIKSKTPELKSEIFTWS